MLGKFPCGDRKEYTDDAGNVTQLVERFSFQLQLLVDIRLRRFPETLGGPRGDPSMDGDVSPNAVHGVPGTMDESVASMTRGDTASGSEGRVSPRGVLLRDETSFTASEECKRMLGGVASSATSRDGRAGAAFAKPTLAEIRSMRSEICHYTEIEQV